MHRHRQQSINTKPQHKSRRHSNQCIHSNNRAHDKTSKQRRLQLTCHRTYRIRHRHNHRKQPSTKHQHEPSRPRQFNQSHPRANTYHKHCQETNTNFKQLLPLQQLHSTNHQVQHSNSHTTKQLNTQQEFNRRNQQRKRHRNVCKQGTFRTLGLTLILSRTTGCVSGPPRSPFTGKKL